MTNYIGRMEPFYRNAAVLSEKVFLGGLELGGELAAVPEYLLAEDIDFPYQARPGKEKELLFTDHISLVRFLGGIGDKIIKCADEKGGKLDLAYRDESGRIRIRHQLIERYRPFVELYGTEITLVLDNIPWVFATGETIDDYGQVNPPNDYDAWCSFLKDMCQALIDSFGFETVNSWRFRLNTEGRLGVETVAYCRHYDLTTAAIREVLPGARFGPYNIAGIGSSHHDIDLMSVVRHCVNGTNLATGEKGSPLDFLSASYYSIPRFGANGKLIANTLSPLERAEQEYAPFWKRARSMSDTCATIPCELHELGILRDEYNRSTPEPGARGAAWLFQLLFAMRTHAQLQRAWHWHTTDVVAVQGKGVGEYKRILRSNGWLYAILDHLCGLETYMLDCIPANPCSSQVSFAAAGFFGATNALLLSGFSLLRNMVYHGYVYVDIPWKVCRVPANAKLQFACLQDDNDVYQKIRNDLFAVGGLNMTIPKPANLLSNTEGYEHPFYDDHMGIMPGTMYQVFGHWENLLANDVGMQYIDEHWETYEEQIKDSLRLKPFSGAVYEHDGFSRIYIPMETPSTMLIKMAR